MLFEGVLDALHGRLLRCQRSTLPRTPSRFFGIRDRRVCNCICRVKRPVFGTLTGTPSGTLTGVLSVRNVGAVLVSSAFFDHLFAESIGREVVEPSRLVRFRHKEARLNQDGPEAPRLSRLPHDRDDGLKVVRNRSLHPLPIGEPPKDALNIPR